MSEPRPAVPRRLGCGLAALGAIGLVVAIGVWLGRRDIASLAPCERFAEVVARELKNCHSGQNTSSSYLIETCERDRVDPSDACLERIDELTCEQLEGGALAAAGDVCRRR